MKHLYIYLLVFLLFSAGCSNRAREYQNTGNGTLPGEIKLPPDYPPEFKIFNDGKILSVNILKEGTEIMFSSESDRQLILERYRAAALESGYVEQNTGKESEINIKLSFFNERENKKVSITLTPSSGGTKTLVTFVYK